MTCVMERKEEREGGREAVEETEDRRAFPFLMFGAHLQSFGRAVCLIRDLLRSLLFIATLRYTCSSVFTATIKQCSSDRLPNIIPV